jgi:hypothetical protein
MENIMIKKLKISALALFATAAAVTARADTNLLQGVTVAFTVYTQGTPSATKNIVNQASFGTKALIESISASGTVNTGDVLARVTPVTNTVVDVTNLLQVSTTNLVITNTSTSNTNIAYEVIFGGVTNAIGTTNVVFGNNIVAIDGTNVTIGTNTATIGTNSATPLIIGTNTSVTVSTLTNSIGEVTGTNYAFVINALNPVPTATNKLGAAYWAIFNPKTTPKITPISTNVLFDIHTDEVYQDGTNLAYLHGEKIKNDGQIESGTTDEIRSLTLSNSTMQIRLEGYAHGSIVPVSLGTTLSAEVVNSQDYHWTGSGSGTSNLATMVITGNVTETYFKLKD